MFPIKKRVFIMRVILYGLAFFSNAAAIMLMALDANKFINTLALALAFVSAALYIFVLFSANRADKKKVIDV